MAEARKKHGVRLASTDREKMVALLGEIQSRQEQMREIAKAAMVGAHPALSEDVKMLRTRTDVGRALIGR